jgi:hypothetical protein
MLDEDSGEIIRCPYCESDGDCEHLLAVIDHSFLECSGGYAFDRLDDLHEMIERAFLKYLRQSDVGKQPQQLNVTWSNEFLEELWAYAEEKYPSEDDKDSVEIDGDVFFRLITDLLQEAGGDEYFGSIDDDGGPGFSSEITLFHAREPAAVFDNAMALLSQRLETGDRATQ